jgi:hypothetical protein
MKYAIVRNLSSTIAIAGLAMVLASTPGQAQELDNEFVTIPNAPAPVPGYTFSGWNGFGILFAGQAVIPPQNPTDGGTDPFAQIGSSGIHLSSLGNNTLLTFSGNPISANNGPFGSTAHFGVNGSGGWPIPPQLWLNPLQKDWTGEEISDSNPNNGYVVSSQVPDVGVRVFWGVPPSIVRLGSLPAVTPDPDYETIFLEYTQDGVVGGSWTEFPIFGTTPVPFTATSGSADAADPIHFTLAGYMITPTQIPLDDLNLVDEPPPGSAGSHFTPMAVPADIPPTPDHSCTLALLGIGTLSLLACGWRRQMAKP